MNKTLKEILNESFKCIDNKNVFKQDILFLIEETFDITQNDIILHDNKVYNDEDFSQKLNRLIKGEPVEHIVGKTYFYGNEFKVTHDTLIPRNETEELIEKTLKYLDEYNFKSPIIADIGSGTGCIAITLNKLVKESIVDSYDISSSALNVAIENNKLNGTSVNFFLSDCLSEAIKNNKKYDVIVSNPPYIDRDTYVQESVLKYEPHLALFADDHGLAIYERILSQIKDVAKEKIFIAFEISPDLVPGLDRLKEEYIPESKHWYEKDMNGLVRFMFILK